MTDPGTRSLVVLVCGAIRSGTTLVDLVLGNGRDAFSAGELYALFRPWRPSHLEAPLRVRTGR